MIKTTFRDYIQWRSRWPDNLTLLNILGIDLFDPTPEEIRRWADRAKDRHFRHQHDDSATDTPKRNISDT